jgi:hypothetical protein
VSVKIDATALGSIILIAVLIAALVQATFMAVLGGGATHPTPAAVPVATAAAASSTPTRPTPAPPNPSGCPSAPPGAGRCARAFTSWVTPGRT